MDAVARQDAISAEELRRIAPVREAGPEDAVDSIQPRFVAEPGSVAAAAALLRLAGERGWAVTPRGTGSKLHLGNPPQRLDLILSTRRLNRLIEHAAGDLVVAAEAGMELRALQEVVARAGQMLALDPPEGGTLGGIIASNASGPLRLRYGTVRDFLIGIKVVLPDGTVARAGGKVVKNVAGYDLCKLYTGSLGTLGLMAEAIFRLYPIPAARRLVALDLDTPDAVAQAVQSYLHSHLVPSALALTWQEGRGTLLALFEGVEPGVVAQAQTARELVGDYGPARVLADPDETWQHAARMPWHGEDAIGLKISTVPTQVPEVLEILEALSRQYGFTYAVAGSPAVSVLYVGVYPHPQPDCHALDRSSGSRARQLSHSMGEGSPAGQSQTVATNVSGRLPLSHEWERGPGGEGIAQLRDGVETKGGSVVVVQAPLELKRQLDVWGSVGDALPLMAQVKARFDPGGVLNPGRFVGGL